MDTEPHPKTRKSVSWRRVGITLLVIFAALWIVYPVSMHVMVWYFASREARVPTAAVIPKSLPVIEVADLSSGADTRALGYSLSVPWPILKQDSGKKFASWSFANGLSATAFDQSGDSMGPGLLVNTTPAQAEAYQRFLGERALSSKYEFLRAELNTTAAEVSFWHSRQRNVAATTMLVMKSALLSESKVVYSATKGQMHGFQFGDPGQSRTVRVIVFDPSDRETWLLFHKGPEAQWSQPQINAIIASIHPAQ